MNDLLARLVGPFLAERLGQPFPVENRPGAASNIATEAVARAAPDGYTLLLVGSANAINTTLYDKLGFDFAKDIAPVASLCSVPIALLVNPAVPARTLSELISFAKANPGKLSMASPGNGSPQHLAGELFKMMAGIDMVHIPYRGGGPAMTDLLSGQVQVSFGSVASSMQYVRGGQLRALGVASSGRLDVLPDVPAIAELLPGYFAIGWYGLGAPAGTSAEVVARLNEASNAAIADPKISARLAELGATPLPGSPADFAKLIADETERWARVVRFSGARPN
ncbi:tripartite tricarboxylate transporter substrate binding protein [uncultured Reyranella sp.]|uniref:Tripartite tricarboxylate transporter substrate binding protein n=1 Tax=Reyranella aquatilis TaxID=2035356 RepID=A0ABS8L410_9HYPH|nr:tripartite tricarboxylate transporter substrate binding protein [uncultured Reyranella sp.]MCC8432511.1 tripartite tricarboxylate transporter substrate binding protein [Reyranella aquatilis]